MSVQKVPLSVEQRIVIRFLRENVLSAEIHHRLQQQYGEECLSWTRVFEWCKCFREGRERVENEPHDHWPRTSITEPNIDHADVLIRENRYITIKELRAMLSISVGSVEDIVKYHLHYRKVNAWWVPRTLTNVNKMVHMQAASCLLQQFEDEGDAFLKSIVTTNEMWVHFFIPESQQSSSEWQHTSSPKPKQAQRSRLARKVMATFFWDWQGVIHVDFLTDARKVNAAYYSDLLATDMKEKIQSKRKTGGKWVAFLQDNARPPTAKTTIETLWKLKWNLLTHPPYSPDLVPSDFYLFGRLKSDLQGMWFCGQRRRHPDCSGMDTPPTTSLFGGGHQDASRKLEKMC
ncbi:hypothetical protein B7P43_G13783 [Cryptotermes secundus]|uniref:Mos1 transposase HTH domain-containing protein n=1 Tax=Cryptotermes secundus TaxID=105785 RepID=A0A2J7RKV9_9NEOP|nr:hypothetical protein B7P43_G13783 [Cryptotermes secundus]